MEPVKKHVEEWRPQLYDVIQSKVDELEMLGYERVTHDEVWNCLLHKVWRKNKETTLFQVVQDVLHMSDRIFMSFLTVQVQQQDEELLQQIEALSQWEKEHTEAE
ncbi:post-transcriptional regulator [Alkalibacillus silvisoli]|uniref:Post-transcriptional regulator n=1 Tax=Alkalibacillus silvisoli TaxID=392823 RepID=A0ABN0ZRX0_9BACI